ncbi:hypothetical protein [Acholeplasma palmae]|uniref:hypothetical protein n=1 Tax=Acholeplasma palmae TaxID=38986 RepID=UPI0005FA1A04|nr:hypothetical protein [Alteracholeplasma palmae]
MKKNIANLMKIIMYVLLFVFISFIYDVLRRETEIPDLIYMILGIILLFISGILFCFNKQRKNSKITFYIVAFPTIISLYIFSDIFVENRIIVKFFFLILILYLSFKSERK